MISDSFTSEISTCRRTARLVQTHPNVVTIYSVSSIIVAVPGLDITRLMLGFFPTTIRLRPKSVSILTLTNQRKKRKTFNLFRSGWRNFDDEYVTSVINDKDLVKSDGYVLFYRHRTLTVNIPDSESTPTMKSPMLMDIDDHASSIRSAHFDDVQDLMA